MPHNEEEGRCLSEEEDRSDEEEPTTSDEEFIDDGSEDESSESSDEDVDWTHPRHPWRANGVWHVTITLERYNALVRMEKKLAVAKSCITTIGATAKGLQEELLLLKKR